MASWCLARNVSLAIVCFQSTAVAIILHASQSRGYHHYKASSAVLITELGKLVLSSCLALKDLIGERRAARRISLHPLPSPELYTYGEQVHASDLYSDDPFNAPKSTGTDHPTHARRSSMRHRSTSSNALKRDIAIEGMPESPNQRVSLEHYSWPKSTEFVNALEKVDHSIEPMLPTSAKRSRPGHIVALLVRDVFGGDWWKMGIPAALFAVQNNLIYVAARNLSVPLFQITFQIKVLITALAAVIMLSRRLAASQWLALFVLAVGVATMKIGNASPAGSSALHQMDYFKGLSSVLVSCCCSAVAATYFELVIKASPSSNAGNKAVAYSLVPSAQQKVTSLWIRNIQLSIFSLVIGLGVIAAQQGRQADSGFLEGFNAFTWLVIALQMAGGLFIALAIKHAGTVEKSFALSLSIVFSFLLSVILFSFPVTFTAVFGVVLVVASTLLFETGDRIMSPSLNGHSIRFGGIGKHHIALIVALVVTAVVAIVPSRHFSLTTTAWDYVASHLDHSSARRTDMPTVAVADFGAINSLLTKSAGLGHCNWGYKSQRWSTRAPYGPSLENIVPTDYPYIVTNTDQFALDDILSVRVMDYNASVPFLADPAPDFIYIPLKSQIYANTWHCNDPLLMDSIEQTTAFIRDLAKSIGPTPYPRIILPLTTLRSNFEWELFKPEIMEELKDSVILVSIENAPKAYTEEMKYLIDMPYPTRFHFTEDWKTDEAGAAAPGTKTDVGDYFLTKDRPYLLAYSASKSHPWGLPPSDPFNGFALRGALHAELAAYVQEAHTNTSMPQVLFKNLLNPSGDFGELGSTYDQMTKATFCLEPAGDSPTRRGFFDALLLGCIPVIFREKSYGRMLPSSPEMHTSQYTVYVDEAVYLWGETSIVERLLAIPQRDIARMQQHMRTIARKMQYSLPHESQWFSPDKPAESLAFNHTTSQERKATTSTAPDAFDLLLKELDLIKAGKWVPGVAKDTRMTQIPFGSWSRRLR